MELHKKSELSVGRASFVISTQLAGEAAPSIETVVTGSDGGVVFETSQDISALKPIFQNGQKVFARLEAQHHSVVKELQQGRIPNGIQPSVGSSFEDKESDALAHAVDLLGKKSYEKATAALRAVLETYPNCSEAREILEVAYKAQSEGRFPVDVELCLRRGTEAFAGGRQRDAIESWKQCLTEEPDNRHLQLLLLITTTWSRSRREKYAAEVLSPDHGFLSSGRPDEAQALLLVTQTVEGAAAAQPSAAEPRSIAAEETVVTGPPFDGALIDGLIEAETSVLSPSPAPPTTSLPPSPVAATPVPADRNEPTEPIRVATPSVVEPPEREQAPDPDLDETVLTGLPLPEPEPQPEPDPDLNETVLTGLSISPRAAEPEPASPTPPEPPKPMDPTMPTPISRAPAETPRAQPRPETKRPAPAPAAPRPVAASPARTAALPSTSSTSTAAPVPGSAPSPSSSSPAATTHDHRVATDHGKTSTAPRAALQPLAARGSSRGGGPRSGSWIVLVRFPRQIRTARKVGAGGEPRERRPVPSSYRGLRYVTP